jgi:hypothetical protein
MTYGSTEHAAQSDKPLDPSTIKGSFIKSPLGIGFVAPLGDPRMLAALNQAGRGVSTEPLKLKASVTIPAFPNGYCAVYQGDVATISPKVSSTAPQGQNNIVRPKITR